MTSPKRLVRKPASGRIGGVCAGIADYLDTDVTLVRLLWVILSIVPGGVIGGLIGYLAAWIIMPESNERVIVPAPPLVVRRAPAAGQYRQAAVLNRADSHDRCSLPACPV